MFEFHVSRQARDRYGFDDTLFSLSGDVIFANLAASREFAERMNRVRDAAHHPERAIHPGALNAMGMIDEALHVIMAQYRQRYPNVMNDALSWLEARLGTKGLENTLLSFVQQFPPVTVYRNQQTAAEWLASSTHGMQHRAIALEELLMLWLENTNPAFQLFKELFDDAPLVRATPYQQLTVSVREYFDGQPTFGGRSQNLIDMLRAPALASPDSLEGQIAFIREQWTPLLGELFRRMLVALDILKEEEMAVWMRFHTPGQHFGDAQTWGDSSAAAVPQFTSAEHEYERFSPDQDWMPRSVMMAKSVYVWLHQLSVAYKREVSRLDQVPDEELDLLARRGFNGLWLIGLWERSRASQRIKQMCGNPEAAASAYSLLDYNIAQDLGGNEAYQSLRDRAWARHIRLASDMVPNHMGIDSRWVIEHPDWFISLPYAPFPVYGFSGPDVSNDGRVDIKIEDHYFDRTDAAVVFQRSDRWSGDTRYIYHGNDGTSFPWNDTAQLNYLKSEVREAVIQTILHVARMFPIIRFDAAMTLTKRHYQRLWFPEPGTGGAIPSRAEHGLTKAEFDAAMPNEFWREVVDRVAAEAPNTLLLAEAFWLMEGYFVRTLGMHRVYNSAFMNMLRDEENGNYRNVIKNTLTFDPDVLKRYVNFMNNPDERTAVDQFGKGDKYFGVCTLMATLPGLPMFGHGQIEGFTERYGMEYRRAYYDEQPDSWLVARHERQISPLLHRRNVFAEVRDFLLFDFFTDHGHVNEDVFAYSNRSGNDRALVVYNNRFASTHGWVRVSCAYAEKTPDGGKHLRRRTLAESFGLSHDSVMFAACRDAVSGMEFLHRSGDLAERGLKLELHAYQCQVFLEWRDLREDKAHPWGLLCDELAGKGVSSLEDALFGLRLRPIHQALRALARPQVTEQLSMVACIADGPVKTREVSALLQELEKTVIPLLEAVQSYLGGVAASVAGIAPPEDWTPHRRVSQHALAERMRAALMLPALSRKAGVKWPAELKSVLPIARPGTESQAVWTAVLGWCAVEALGCLLDPRHRDAAAAQLFDALRLREPLAEMLAEAGLEGADLEQEKWRAVARIRASFAHSSRSSVPYSWIHDPDVAWAMGVHQYEGVTYAVKEQFERLLGWMAFRGMLDAAAAQPPDLERISTVAEEIRARAASMETAGYNVEALEESDTLDVLHESEQKKPERT
ncbi:MAG TPA: alpha-amylase family glycosyl hydrolase [Candidatus Angelobacter sp.]|nr:alpha-amylase family glycosyl hydrolase [Candidatus Angelobacter sp.]